MQDPNFTKRHLLTDKVDVDLDVPSVAMLHRVGRHVDGGDVVAVDKRHRM